MRTQAYISLLVNLCVLCAHLKTAPSSGKQSWQESRVKFCIPMYIAVDDGELLAIVANMQHATSSSKLSHTHTQWS